ncbi:ATP-binding protein [Paenibacillus soyae]|uniref:ATP-binding protein n=1 Tax=Paenibacillus soyae TaxID=2969249 RepID=A0A9X2MMF3_9BACL|nr:ATP-binding protein [Paenibacillus soyae]MCR2803351.1 ATP-binding protein [Paenibacillus soyae]
MSASEKLSNAQRTLFVGRSEELEALRRYAAGDEPWQWLHIYGQGGMGKSALLRQFRMECANAGMRVGYLDGSRAVRQAEETFGQLEEAFLVRSGSAGPGESGSRSNADNHAPILLVDELDQLRPIEHRFLQWLETLREPVRVVSACRHSLTGGWLRSSWAARAHSLRLRELNPSDVGRYAQERGLVDEQVHAHLYRFSGGVPLAMTLTAESMLRNDNPGIPERGDRFQLLSTLMADLLRGYSPAIHRLLEAASVYRCFNEERLAAILNEPSGSDEFRAFAGLPFLSLTEDGWMLHDAVRAWALEDLTMRKPVAYEQMRRKALKQLQLEEQLNPSQRSKLQLDKMSLHEQPVVRAICASGHLDEVELRMCREADVAAVQELYIRFHRHSFADLSADPPMVSLLRSLWQAEPSSFITLWKQDRMIAFFSKIPLRGKTLALLQTEPLLLPFFSAWKPIPNAYLFSLIGIEPDLESKTRGYIITALINHFSRSEWILDFTCLQEWFPVFELCGFERLPWADAATEDGIEFRAFALDLRQEDFVTKMDRAVNRSMAESASNVPADEEAIPSLRLLLKNWHALPRKSELSQMYARLFPHRTASPESDGNMGYAAQKALSEAIQRLCQGYEREELYGKLLHDTYLEKIRPAERIAKKWNMSPATYYRYLNLALEQLFQDLTRGQ